MRPTIVESLTISAIEQKIFAHPEFYLEDQLWLFNDAHSPQLASATPEASVGLVQTRLRLSPMLIVNLHNAHLGSPFYDFLRHKN
jgi:hypothetical protein